VEEAHAARDGYHELDHLGELPALLSRLEEEG
jgi:hypothetical protein